MVKRIIRTLLNKKGQAPLEESPAEKTVSTILLIVLIVLIILLIYWIYHWVTTTDFSNMGRLFGR